MIRTVFSVATALLFASSLQAEFRQIDLTIFGGLTANESAEVLGISEVTVRRELRMAKAWLQRELKL